jgi:lipooligosaccharide transport system permease protein
MSASAALLRVMPPMFREARRPQRMIERSVLVYRRTWILLVSGFFEPLFYLLSIRIGFGKLVGDVEFAGRTVDYANFVAPALMASSAMNGAVYDSTMNVFFKIKHARLYEAVLATPMNANDVALGEIGWAVIRGSLYSFAFMICLVVMGMTDTAWVVLALPACLLIGLAFASVGMAATTYMRSWADFDWVQAAVMPMFLFSCTFYPLSSYGDWGWIMQISPLYHGVALVRGASLGVATWGMVGHAVVLLAIAAVGLGVAARRVETLLLK